MAQPWGLIIILLMRKCQRPAISCHCLILLNFRQISAAVQIPAVRENRKIIDRRGSFAVL